MAIKTFTIDGLVQVFVEETDEGLKFTLALLEGTVADIRGFFFSTAENTDLNSLAASGANVTDARFKENGVVNLGNGANLNGKAGRDGGFDAGIELGTPGIGGDDIQGTSFTVAGLTFDDIEGQNFGVRLNSVEGEDGSRDGSLKLAEKGVTLTDVPEENVPPVAVDDSFFVELGDTLLFDVLANDFDANGNIDQDTLAFSDADGTAVAVEGQLSYTANVPTSPGKTDNSQVDTFSYTVRDTNFEQSNKATVSAFVVDPKTVSFVAGQSYTLADGTGRVEAQIDVSHDERTIDDDMNLSITVSNLSDSDAAFGSWGIRVIVNGIDAFFDDFQFLDPGEQEVLQLDLDGLLLSDGPNTVAIGLGVDVEGDPASDIVLEARSSIELIDGADVFMI